MIRSKKRRLCMSAAFVDLKINMDVRNREPVEQHQAPNADDKGGNVDPMDLDIYRAARKGDVGEFIRALDLVSKKTGEDRRVISEQLSPLKNTYLHVAASYGHENVAGFIVKNFPYLLSRKNADDDTAIHLAARAGHAGTLRIFMEDDPSVEYGGTIENWQRTKNKEGNTPLHEACIHKQYHLLRYLLPRHGRSPALIVNNERKSPLYLVVETVDIKNFGTIMESLRFESEDLEEQLKEAKSLVHAAIRGKSMVILTELLRKRPSLINFNDEKRRSPLHFAASVGFLEAVRYLLKEFRLETFAMDEDGLCPIHAASKYGHVDVIQVMLQHYPDAREVLNGEGQNIFHIAAKYGRDNVVKYVIQTRELEVLLNEKDKSGNTALHLASRYWHPKVLSSLTWDKRVEVDAVNKEGLTALALVEQNMKSMPSYRKRLTWMALMSGGVPRAKHQDIPNLKRLQTSSYQSYDVDYTKDRVNTLLLVATLVATVTFAAGFTMPGGYNSSEPNQGMATLLFTKKFQVFVVFNTIAMYSSVITAITLIWAQLGDLNLIVNVLRFTIPLLGLSLTMMSLAFMVGVLLLVSPLKWLVILVLVMGMAFLVSLLILFVPLNLPYCSNNFIARHVSYYPFCLLILASGSY